MAATGHELIAFGVAQAPDSAFLVGHSLDRLLSLLVACPRPDLVKGQLLLDSPIVTGWRAPSIHALKASGLRARVGPGRVFVKRREPAL